MGLVISLEHGEDGAGVFITCHLPNVFLVDDASVRAACRHELVPLGADLVVNRWLEPEGGGEVELEAVERTFRTTEEFAAVGNSCGYRAALPLLPAGDAGPLSLERWAE
jgi:hypothetical protein